METKKWSIILSGSSRLTLLRQHECHKCKRMTLESWVYEIRWKLLAGRSSDRTKQMSQFPKRRNSTKLLLCRAGLATDHCRIIDDVIRPNFGASVFVWTSRCESDPSRNLSVSKSTAHHETTWFDHFLIRRSWLRQEESHSSLKRWPEKKTRKRIFKMPKGVSKSGTNKSGNIYT